MRIKLFVAFLVIIGITGIIGGLGVNRNMFLSVFETCADAASLQIDESNVDTFLPVDDFSDTYDFLMRSYQPFGNQTYVDMENSTLQIGMGAVRINHVKLNGEEYWIDFTINLNKNNIPLEITDWGTDTPPAQLPHWQNAVPGIDFRLASADIYGPPARIRFFNVGIDNRLYDLDFTIGSTFPFVLSGVNAGDYIHYLPDANAPEIIAASPSNTLPTYSNNSVIKLTDECLLDPIAIPWTGEDGEFNFLVNYDGGSVLQKMYAHDGVLTGTYLPPVNNTFLALLDSNYGTFASLWNVSFLKTPTIDEKLTACIKEKTRVLIGLKSDNTLSTKLTNLVFTMIGSSTFELSSETMKKITSAIADSKDAVIEMMANGKVDKDTLGIWLTSTILKNTTSEENEKIVEFVWGSNIPDYASTAASASGSVAGKDYKLAAQALAKGIASNIFPVYTAAVETVNELVKYGKDELANDAFQELYQVYKDNGGTWNDIDVLSVLSINKFAGQKAREILKAQQKPYDDAAVRAYLKTKMENLYAQEANMALEQKKLEFAKDQYLSLSLDQRDFIKNILGEGVTECDMFQKYLDYVSRIQVDLKNSIKNCDLSTPTASDIEDESYFLVKYLLCNDSYASKKLEYQKHKLDWLKVVYNCLNIEDSSSSSTTGVGHWELANTIIYTDPTLPYKDKCGEHTISLSNGSFTTTLEDYGCYSLSAESVTFTGSWTPPPSSLTPGDTYSMILNIKASNATTDWHWGDDIGICMDKDSIEWGFGSGYNINISEVKVDTIAGKLSDSWSGTFTAPQYGYADSDSTNQFEIMASVQEGCVRYIYKWVQ